MESTKNSSYFIDSNKSAESAFENPLRIGYIRNLFIAAFSIVCSICILGRYVSS